MSGLTPKTNPLNNPDANKRNLCVLDDNTTTGCLSYLMELSEFVNASWLQASIQKCLNLIVQIQYTNGGWPQCYPLKGNYRDGCTFNDAVINNCIAVMFKAYRIYGDVKYLNTALKGCDYIIASQLPAPQAAWAEQYDANSGEPIWARAFEPPSVCPITTKHNIGTLIFAYLVTEDSKYLDPILPAFDWLQRSMLDGQLLAHHYELGTNKPIYVPRKGGTIYYDYDKITAKERKVFNYQIKGDFSHLADFYNEVVSVDVCTYLEQNPNILQALEISQIKNRVPSLKQTAQDQAKLPKAAAKVARALDAEGRWMGNRGKKMHQIYASEFVRNFNHIYQYMKMIKEGPIQLPTQQQDDDLFV